jgi:aryl carrier-like protein
MKPIAPSPEAALLERIEALNAKVQAGLASIRTIRWGRRTIQQALAIGLPSLSPTSKTK